VKIRSSLALLTVAALLTAGCGDQGQSYTESTPSATAVNPSELPDHQAPPDRFVVRVTIKDGIVTPTNEQLQAAVGQPIVFRVDSDTPDELHVHSNPEHSFKIEAKPGQMFQFTVDVPGKVDVELHQLNKTVATITVR
jgi:hypothetical protein